MGANSCDFMQYSPWDSLVRPMIRLIVGHRLSDNGKRIVTFQQAILVETTLILGKSSREVGTIVLNLIEKYKSRLKQYCSHVEMMSGFQRWKNVVSTLIQHYFPAELDDYLLCILIEWAMRLWAHCSEVSLPLYFEYIADNISLSRQILVH